MDFIEITIQSHREISRSTIRLNAIVAVSEAPGEPDMSIALVCVGEKVDSFRVCEAYTSLRARIIEAARKDG